MRKVHVDLVLGLVGQLLLLGVLAAVNGLTAIGWLVGIGCGVTTCALLLRGFGRSGASALGPADRVTLTRTVLVGGVTALVADASVGPVPVGALVSLAAIALILDGVDGWVARRTDTASALGARFDMEVDAFLILVLSLYVASSVGVWVLAIGAARYLFVSAAWLLPAMRVTLPFRYWRKVVAASQGIALTLAAAEFVPSAVATAALLGALALLSESFGRDVWWLWRQSIVRARPTRRLASSATLNPWPPQAVRVRSRT